jgi:large repetitive protein
MLGLSGWSQNCNPTFIGDTSTQSVECSESTPDFPELSASSECCPGDVEVTTFTSETGRKSSECVISTAFGPGIDWALWLPGVNPASVAWHFTEGGMLEEYADGTARIWGHVTSAADPTQGFEVNMWLQNARNWEEWSALGRGYKDDFNLAADHFDDWTYYELVNGFSTLTGTGSLEGSNLEITHFPVNYYYGFQFGTAANNKNANDGMSGWFYYAGTINGEYKEGHGDINVDKDCSTIENPCGESKIDRIYRAEDTCGNVSFTASSILITDTQAPIIAPFEATLSIDCADVNAVFIEAQDLCSGVGISFTDSIAIPGCNGLIYRTYTISDGCGNSVQVEQVLDLFGGIPPEFIDFPANTEIECTDFEGMPEPLVTFTPGCANTELTFTDSIVQGSCAGSFTLIRTYVLSDDCGNNVSQDYVVTVVDTTPPQLFNIPENETIQCGDPIADALVFGIDGCSGLTVVSLTASTEQLNCGYRFIRTWSTQDACGNPFSASQIITVEDGDAPEFATTSSVVSVNCGSVIDITAPDVSDACSNVTVTFADTPSEEGCLGSFVRTYTATDGCNNTATFQQLVLIVDQQAPTFDAFPEDITVSCDQIPSEFDAEIAFSDNCGTVNVSYNETIAEEFCANSYVLERTWTLTDECGQQTSRTWTLFVVDEEGPQLIGVPEDGTLACGEAVPDAIVVGVDNCSGVVMVSLSAITTETPDGTVLVRTWTAMDDCGNSTSLEQFLLVSDAETPVWTFQPNDVEVSCGEEYEIGTPTAEDDCGDVDITFLDAPLQGSCTNSFIRTWTATDNSGNSVSFEQFIIITDTVGPDFDFVPSADTISCGQPIPVVLATATDACSGIADVTYTDAPGVGCTGSLIRTFTATDVCGNSTEAIQTITIIDNENPTPLNTPENITVSCADEVPSFDADLVLFEDNCALLNVSASEEILEGECANDFIVRRLWIATDVCGNRTTIRWDIVVDDEQGPELINVPLSDTLQCGLETVPEPPLVTANDNCNGDVPVVFNETTTNLISCGFRVTRTWSAEDACGNITTATQIILVTDTVDPYLLDIPENITVGCGEEIPPVQLPLAMDDCAGPVSVFLAENQFPGTCPGEFSIQRVFRAFDNCGNSVIATQWVIVEDTVGPEFNDYPFQLLRPCGDSDGIYVSATDACGNADNAVTITYTDQIIGGGCGGTIERTYEATDACGNSSFALQFIQRSDSQAPEFDSFPADITVSCDQIPDVSSAGIVFSDNCSAVTTDYLEVLIPGDCANEYTLERTWTLQDGCGNSRSQTWTIDVFDNSGPQIFGVPANETVECGTTVSDAIVFALDNCDGVVPVSLTASTTVDGCTSTLTRTWSCTDECGNDEIQTQVITFIDTTTPEFSNVPANVQLTCGDELPDVPVVTANDACSGPADVTFNEQFIGISNCPTIVRTWCAEDCSENGDCVEQTITFELSNSPQLLEIQNNGGSNVQLRFAVVSADVTLLELRNLNGQLVETLYNQQAESGHLYNVPFDTTALSRGVYFVTLKNGDRTTTKKLVVAL